jgi:hypothetical protein
MLYYSDAALRYAVDRCLEEDGYRIGIATKEKKEALEKLLLRKEDFLKVRNYNNQFEILFKNGSLIRYIPLSSSSRGYALNLLIVDEDVDNDLLETILIRLEKVEWVKRRQRQQTKMTRGNTSG